MGALPGDAELFGDMRDRAALQHPLNQDHPTGRRQPRITVDHEKAFLFEVSRHHSE